VFSEFIFVIDAAPELETIMLSGLSLPTIPPISLLFPISVLRFVALAAPLKIQLKALS
jgi:hypothetical protein